LRVENDSDAAAERLALAIQHRELVDILMASRGLPADSLERLKNALWFEMGCFLFSECVAYQFPEEQRHLVMTLLFALLNYPRGQYMRAVNEKGRELTTEERDELKERCESTLKSLPEIVRKLMPDEFEDCAVSIFDPPERLYKWALRPYLKEYKRQHGQKSPHRNKIDGQIAKRLMSARNIPMDKQRAFCEGLKYELRLDYAERQRRRKANQKNDTNSDFSR
jgi:hypothetical protein